MPSLMFRSPLNRFGPSKFRRAGDKARARRAWKEAAALYESYLEKRPDDAAIRIQAGHMRKEAGELASAERHYLRAKALTPEDADLHLQLGHFYRVAGRPLESFAAYRDALRLDPNNESALSGQADMGRRLRAELGDPDEEGLSDTKVSLNQAIRALTVDDIRESGLFDPNWYIKTNADVAQLGLDPLQHFFLDGRREGRRPGPGFEPEWYLEAYPEVARLGVEPFGHYLVAGRHQGMRPAGPPRYERWVKAFDTLGDTDFQQIDAHICDEQMPAPDVVLYVSAENERFVSRSIRGLRGQRLRPRSVYISLAPDVTETLTRELEAAVGVDPAFQIVSHKGRELRMVGAIVTNEVSDVILLQAGVELREHALYLLMLARMSGALLAYGDEDRIDAQGFRCDPFFKPDASPLLLLQTDYVGGCVLMPSGLSAESLAWEFAHDLSAPDDVVRSAFLDAERKAIAHVPHILAHDHRGAKGKPRFTRAALPDMPTGSELPSVTIIVPTRDRLDLLSVCLESLLDRTDYPKHLMDVVVVDNGSTDPATLDYLGCAVERGYRVIRDQAAFNYARLNNIAAKTSTGDILILLNNDTEVVDPNWLKGLIRYVILPDVAAVGPKLLYADGTIQHAGVVLGIGVAAAHAHVGLDHDAPGIYGFAQRTREVAAVTGACLAIRRSVFEELGGLDERLAVAFNDVDLCLSALAAGYRNIYVHDVWMRHFESKSRGVDDTPEKVDAFITEANYARRKHPEFFFSDPFYNVNLSVILENFYEPALPPRCSYPWREHHRTSRHPRVLLLGALSRPTSEIAHVMSYQANFLAERGYEVVYGTPGGSAPTIGRHSRVRCAAIRDQQAAARYAVVHDIDCVIAHTSLFAGTGRLLGNRPKVIIQHHGFGVEAHATGRVARDEKVAIRLALPAASAVLASSSAAADELEDHAIIVEPGGDRLGAWTQLSANVSDRLREEFGWSDKIVVLMEQSIGKTTGPIDADVAAWVDSKKVVLVPMSEVDLSESLNHAKKGASQAELLTAAHIYWPAFGGSAMSLAEAESFGLAVLPSDEPWTDGRRIAHALTAAVAESGFPGTWSRRSRGARWADVLDKFHDIVQRYGELPYFNRGSAPMLLHPDRLVEDSGIFDEVAYRHFNPDVAALKIDPWQHFINHGAIEGRRPSYLFDSKWYLTKYPEVALAQASPLAHYLSFPVGSYDPNPYFSNEFYLETYKDVKASGLAPLVHYLRIGAAEGRSVGPGFDADFYCRAYADAGASGMLPFVHFMTIGDAEGRLPVKPQMEPVNLFDDAALVLMLDRPLVDIVPTAGKVVHRPSAARFCINLLRKRDDLRARFPDALSAGAKGNFARWIENEGGAELGLSSLELHHIRTLLASNFAARLRQAYLVRSDLRRLMPFAFLPEGAGTLLRWGLEQGLPHEGFTLEELWWLLLECAEDPDRELWTTYSFTPAWQLASPDAETVFGEERLREWLHDIFGLEMRSSTGRVERVSPAEAIRLAYNAHANWRKEHPDAFSSQKSVAAFLAWLGTPAAKTPQIARSWLARQDHPALMTDLLTSGVNIMGHFCYPSGLKVSTLALVRGCHEVGLATSERDIWVQQPGDEDRHIEYRGAEIYEKTIMLCQPEPLFDTAYSRAGLAPRGEPTYRIGYWYWEQDEIPDVWIEKSKEVDEVWTSTHFVGDALRKKLHVPVHVIPHGIEVPSFERRSRAFFGLPEDHYLFLFTFHMMSVMERKNPLGLIQAFKEEFAPSEKVSLILKTSFGAHHPSQMEELRRAASGANIKIIDSVFPHDQILALMECCDSYISLHRSEGYGLTMAEAMLIGKPTIATGYSGNLEFMSHQNSLLVKYDMVKLDRDFPPYKVGSRWARASLKHAAECMRRVQSQPDWGRALGARAKQDLEKRLSFATCGKMIKTRLEQIDLEISSSNQLARKMRSPSAG